MSAATTTDVIRFLGLSDVADTTTGQASFPLGILYPYSQDLRRVCACYDDLADEDPGTAAALLGGRWRARRVARSQGPNSRVTPRGHRHAPPLHRVRARSRRRLGRSRLPTGVRHARVPQVVDRPERPQTGRQSAFGFEDHMRAVSPLGLARVRPGATVSSVPAAIPVEEQVQSQIDRSAGHVSSDWSPWTGGDHPRLDRVASYVQPHDNEPAGGLRAVCRARAARRRTPGSRATHTKGSSGVDEEAPVCRPKATLAAKHWKFIASVV